MTITIKVKNMKICPLCKSNMVLIGSKFICTSEECNFLCSIDDYNFENLSIPWNIKLTNNTDLWYTDAFEKFPMLIADEYKRLYSLLQENKIYGALFQIKDLFEVIIKFPTLLILNKYCNIKPRNKVQNEIIKFLLSYKLSLGHWVNIADKCYKNLDEASDIKNLLNKVLILYKLEGIVSWRNTTIGHGALQFDNSKEFQNDIVSKIKVLKLHFEECKDEYTRLLLGVKKGKKNISLMGGNINLKGIEGKLYYYYNNEKVEIENFIKLQSGYLYLFDSYMSKMKKTKLLNYSNAKVINEKLNYFDNLFESLAKEIEFTTKNSSGLDDDIYMASEENILNSIDSPVEVKNTKYLNTWLDNKINNNEKGIYLLKMEAGMGKTTFSRMLDPHALSVNKLGRGMISIRVYYVNDSYSYKPQNFINNFVEMMKYDEKKKDYIKGNIPQFNEMNSSNKKGAFAKMLEYFREVHQSKFAKNKLLLIIDGIDEIPFSDKETIFDYIPMENDIAKGIYLLLTSRTESENSKFTNIKLSQISSNNILEIKKDNPIYIENLESFLKENYKVKNRNTIKNILKYSDNKFLYIKPLKYLLKFKDEEFINSNINIFEEFIKLLKDTYSEKYYMKLIDILLILGTSRNGVTLRELSYLSDGTSADFKFLAYITDITPLLKKERGYRGNTINLAHNDLKKYLITNYKLELKQISERWLEELQKIKEPYNQLSDSQKYILLNTLHLILNFNKEKAGSMLIVFKKLILDVLAGVIHLDLKNHEVTNILESIDDSIILVSNECGKIKNSDEVLFCLYLMKIELFLVRYNKGDFECEEYFKKCEMILEKCTIHKKTVQYFYHVKILYYNMGGELSKLLTTIEDSEKFSNKARVNDDELNEFIDIKNKLDKAIVYKNQKNTDKALKLTREVCELTAKNTDKKYLVLRANALNNLGLIQKNLDMFDEALISFNKSISILENNSKIGKHEKISNILTHGNIGQTLRGLRKFDEAIDAYNKGIELSINFEREGFDVPTLNIGILYNGRANIYRDLSNMYQVKNYQELALCDYIKALNLLEKDKVNVINKRFYSQLLLNIRTMHGTTLNDKEMIRKYTEVSNIRLKKDKVMSSDEKILKLLNKAKNFKSDAQYSNAIKAYHELIPLVSDKRKEKGNTFLVEIHFNKAECQYSLLMDELKKNYILNHYSKVKGNYRKFKPKEIVESYKIALESNILGMKEQSDVCSRISNINCEVLRDFDSALKYTKKQIEIGYDLATGYCGMGNIYCELNKFEEAVNFYEQALQIDSNHGPARQNLSYAKLQLRKK